jgi:hypothetical protein
MTVDLEELIRKRQDRLRGRPEDWIDRFIQRKDRLKIVAVIVLLITLICAWIAWWLFN